MMDLWHEWRQQVWTLRYLHARGRLAHMDLIGTWDQWTRQMVEAEAMIAEGRAIYHRLKCGMTP